MIAKFLVPKNTKKGRVNSEQKIRLDKYEVDWDAKSKSKLQKRVKDFLYPYWKNHYVYEECNLVGTRLSFDLYNHTRGIVVESQGEQHNKHVAFFHGKGISGKLNFLGQLKRDDFKMDFCDINDILFVQVYEKDFLSKEFFYEQGLKL